MTLVYFISLRPSQINPPSEYCNNVSFTLALINKNNQSILIIKNIGNITIDGFEIYEVIPENSKNRLYLDEVIQPTYSNMYHEQKLRLNKGHRILVGAKYNAGEKGYLSCNSESLLKEIRYED